MQDEKRGLLCSKNNRHKMERKNSSLSHDQGTHDLERHVSNPREGNYFLSHYRSNSEKRIIPFQLES